MSIPILSFLDLKLNFAKGDFDSWKKIVDTNLYGLMVGCGLGLKQMKEHDIKDGHIININSVGGIFLIITK